MVSQLSGANVPDLAAVSVAVVVMGPSTDMPDEPPFMDTEPVNLEPDTVQIFTPEIMAGGKTATSFRYTILSCSCPRTLYETSFKHLRVLKQP
jgi:hypothetical protein